MKKSFVTLALASSVIVVRASSLTVTHLQCEYASNPLGVDVTAPRLSWVVESPERGQRQTGFQVLAASSAECLSTNGADLWDTGKVKLDETIQIPYAGKALVSSKPVFWKVRVWDKDGQASAWSEPATWTMGLLADAAPPSSADFGEAGWHARWIMAADTNHPSLMMRRGFTVRQGLRRALVHVCGLGQYELSVNGVKSGDDLLAPGWTQYDHTCLYDTRDITALLQEGPNAIGLILGNGMYNVNSRGRYKKFRGSFGPLKAIAQIRLEYADGTVEIIGTDHSWRVAPGPMTFTCVYGGEDYDPRLEPAGWNKGGFDDSGWEAATETVGPGGKLRGLSCAAPPIKAIETLTPAKTWTLTNGDAVYDLGQNAPVMIRLRARGPAGSILQIRPAELLSADGSVNRHSSGRGDAYWQYTLAGKGTEEWFPKFFYHGCRYLQVKHMAASTNSELPEVESLVGVVAHSSSEPVGRFACSNDLFNRIHTLVRWAQRGNMVSVLTDCPHRERLGWLEQYHLNGPSLRYEFDLAQLYTKGMNDMADVQMPNGFIPEIAPEYTVFGGRRDNYDNVFRNSPEWSSAFIMVPWQQYLFDGDLELVRRHYEEMKRYVDYLGSRATNDIVRLGLSDWYDLGPKVPGFCQLTPRGVTATAFYHHDTETLAKFAVLLGRKAEAKELRHRATQIRTSFNKTYFDPATGNYATGSQCANAMALVMGLVEPKHRAAVLGNLVKDVRTRGNTAGDVGFRYVLLALAQNGRSDVIFDMNNQSNKPGYGYQLAHGATSLTESWTANRGASQNHFMLGQILEWFYAGLAGIAPDAGHPGFKHIIVKPEPVGDLTWVKADYDSVRGTIATEWHRSDGRFTLKLTIPPNTTATVFMPAKGRRSVTESGKPAAKSPGVKFLREEDGRAVFKVDSGGYEFSSAL